MLLELAASHAVAPNRCETSAASGSSPKTACRYESRVDNDHNSAATFVPPVESGRAPPSSKVSRQKPRNPCGPRFRKNPATACADEMIRDSAACMCIRSFSKLTVESDKQVFSS